MSCALFRWHVFAPIVYAAAGDFMQYLNLRIASVLRMLQSSNLENVPLYCIMPRSNILPSGHFMKTVPWIKKDDNYCNVTQM